MSAQQTRETPARLFPVLTEFPPRRSFGSVISHRREEMGLTKREVARRIGFTDSMLARTERGERSPDIKYLSLIARTLRIELGALSMLFLRERVPRVYAALIETPSIQNKIDGLPLDLRETVIEMIDRLYNQEHARRSA
jgi:transcriptional regulator with XRE-family HTH domain